MIRPVLIALERTITYWLYPNFINPSFTEKPCYEDMLTESAFGFQWRLCMFVVKGLRMHIIVKAFLGLAAFEHNGY